MCGRFVSATPPGELARYFDVEAGPAVALPPSYNVAPTDEVAIVVETGGRRRIETSRWGLVPWWAKDLRTGNKMINARAATLATSGAFRRAFRKRRCIVPADGFFEWRLLPDRARKQPTFIRRRDGQPLAMAGLWELWRPPERRDDDAAAVRSFTIVTGEPNELVAEVHDRMPVLLPASAWDAWLDPVNDDLDYLGTLLVPAPSDLLLSHPVSEAVNDVRAKGPELIAPLEHTAGAGDGRPDRAVPTQATLL